MPDWTKQTSSNFLSDLNRYESYLEICLAFDRSAFHKNDKSRFQCGSRLCTDSIGLRHQLDINFRLIRPGLATFLTH
jgi:hypothetical protein